METAEERELEPGLTNDLDGQPRILLRVEIGGLWRLRKE